MPRLGGSIVQGMPGQNLQCTIALLHLNMIQVYFIAFVFSILCHFTFVLSFMLKMCKMMARQTLRSSDHFVCELYDF